ncbi:DUF2147 domain-containing protein [Breoghania sp. L-A4]|uniref:DUF2147 domain-containing protein n=1 Tax=Breoghania sp. L-A4 TaxID=2304600 RepID=UPI000E360692|nr:DUF2147 domain-containing protein [Breoghania sp. L-A4]AXS40296.1 DUF2147 domain-containing protein [Breoghania sp. L-A4]
MSVLKRGLRAAAILSAPVVIAAAVLVTTQPAAAADAKGVWARPSGTSRIQISSCGKALCGKLVWLKNPRKDDKNPDKSKRDRPLLGVQTVINMVPSGDDSWKGKVYNAEDGKTYKGVMELTAPNKLKLEGCVLGGLICKGETWNRYR